MWHAPVVGVAGRFVVFLDVVLLCCASSLRSFVFLLLLLFGSCFCWCFCFLFVCGFFSLVLLFTSFGLVEQIFLGVA